MSEPSEADGWSPTSADINAMPERVRRWIHDLETRCDPAGDLRARRQAEDDVRMLRAALAKTRGDRDMEWWAALCLVDSVAPEPEAVKGWLATLSAYEQQRAREEGERIGAARERGACRAAVEAALKDVPDVAALLLALEAIAARGPMEASHE